MNSKNGEPVITGEREVYRNTRIINSSRKCMRLFRQSFLVRQNFFLSFTAFRSRFRIDGRSMDVWQDHRRYLDFSPVIPRNDAPWLVNGSHKATVVVLFPIPVDRQRQSKRSRIDGSSRAAAAAAWLGSMDLASGQSRGLLHFLPSKLSPRGVVRAFASAKA